MQETTHIDRRVVKTKRAIKEAFAKLLTQKDINDITISDIAAEANINHKTFYNYYGGIYEVVGEIEDDIVRLIDKEVTGIGFQNSLQSPYLIFEKLTKVIKTDTDFFGYLLGMNANVSLESKIADLLKSKFKLFVLQDVEISELRLNLMAEFIISGMVAVYRRWFNSDRSEPIETISKEMQLLAFEGLNGFLDVELEKFDN
ncbi:MAG: TetR/AcrR family transcriptional regulator C-terminal domain-containing protein [Ruminococcus sp.]|nr:TetR/AcrR family transcriptional regulator C-terminal domain-containing protein [Ruminococcus sp.]